MRERTEGERICNFLERFAGSDFGADDGPYEARNLRGAMAATVAGIGELRRRRVEWQRAMGCNPPRSRVIRDWQRAAWRVEKARQYRYAAWHFGVTLP